MLEYNQREFICNLLEKNYLFKSNNYKEDEINANFEKIANNNDFNNDVFDKNKVVNVKEVLKEKNYEELDIEIEFN